MITILSICVARNNNTPRLLCFGVGNIEARTGATEYECLGSVANRGGVVATGC